MKKITLLLSFVAFAMVASAQLLFTEDFNYTLGSGIKAAGWAIHSGAGANPDSILVVEGLSFDGYVGSTVGGAASVTGKYADQHKTFASQTSGTVYASFMVKSLASNAAASYFIHFGPSVISTTFFSRVWINISGNGLGLGDTAPSTFSPISINTTYLIVLKYDFTTKTNSLFVFNTMPTAEPTNPQLTFVEIKGPAATTPTDLGSIALRQGQTSGVANQNVIVDGIRVAKTWADLFTASGLNTTTESKLEAFVSGKNLLIKNIAEGSEVEIFSAVGSKVQTSAVENGKVSIANLKGGMYIVRSGKLTQKIRL